MSKQNNDQGFDQMNFDKELHKTQLLLKASLESFKDTIILSIDKEYSYLFFNIAHKNIMKHLFGVDIEIGMNILDSITIDYDRKKTKSSCDRALSGESHSIIEEYGDHERSYIATYKPIFDNKEIIIGATVVAQDITEQKKMEEALLGNNARHAAMIANIGDVIGIVGADGIMKYKSPNIERWFGWKPEDLVGKEGWHTVHPEDIDEIKKNFYKLIEKDNGQVTLEYRYKCKNGTYSWIELKAINCINNPAIKGVLLNYHDITERKKLEESLRKSEATYRDLLLNIQEGVVVHAPDTSIEFLNQQASLILGLSEDQLRGKQAIDHRWKFLRENETTMPLEEYPVNLVVTSKKPLKNYVVGVSYPEAEDIVWVLVNGYLVLDFNNEIKQVIITFIDITERKKLEEERQKSQKIESVGLLAGGIAHDFNNLLNGVIGNINIAQLVVDDKEQVLEKLKVSERILMQASHLTHQLLTFSKGGTPVKECFFLPDLIQECAELALSGSDIELKCDFDKNNLSVFADKGQIRQVIQNLVINAKQSMFNGGVIKISYEDIFLKKENSFQLNEGYYVKISLEDSGIGIPQEYLSKIFDPYFTTKSKGHGLGLAVIYSIIKKHEGYITVDSEIGKGTIFNITLPAFKEKKMKDSAKETETIFGKGRVLVMDDEDFMRDILKEGLNRMGFEVETASTGEKAIELYKTVMELGNLFDIVILDLTVKGGMGGKEIITELHKINPAVKAIAISGYTTDPVMSNPEEFGFIVGVPKPCTPRNLATIINKILLEDLNVLHY